MMNWATISSLATAGGTLVLAIATFSSVRSANRSARSAEQALRVGMRPVLFPSHPQDISQAISWGDHHRTTVEGGRAIVEFSDDGVLYLAMSLRNVASGIAVLQSWRAEPALEIFSAEADALRRAGWPHPDPARFRLQSRDLYVPAGDVYFWQAAFRDPHDPDLPAVLEALANHRGLTVYLLYADHEGGQRTISQFGIMWEPVEGSDWSCIVARHWNLDRPDPR